jgi:hypothetical protein
MIVALSVSVIVVVKLLNTNTHIINNHGIFIGAMFSFIDIQAHVTSANAL